MICRIERSTGMLKLTGREFLCCFAGRMSEIDWDE